MSDQDAAAAKIQALQRGKKAREETEKVKKEKAEQAEAATKIQAIQRGREARKEAEEKKKKLQEEKEQAEAAMKIQSLQRGRKAREAAELRKAQKHGPFARPFIRESEREAIVALRSTKALQAFKCFDDVIDMLQEQFPARGIDRDQVYYSTTQAPDIFASKVTQQKFEDSTKFHAINEVHKRGDLGIVGFWEYGEKKKKKYRIARKKVEGKGAVLMFEQECQGDRGEINAELVPADGITREKDKPPEGFKAQWFGKLKNAGGDPEGVIWLRLTDDDLKIDSIFRPEGVDPKQPGSADKLVRLTACGKPAGPPANGKQGKGRRWVLDAELIAREEALSKKKRAVEEKERKLRSKEVPREIALRAHEVATRQEQLQSWQSMQHVKVVFTGYQPTSVQEAFRNHITALAGRDVALALRDYTGRSVIRVIQGDEATGAVTVHTGTSGAREVWRDVCTKLGDAPGLAVPTQDVEEEASAGGGVGHAFYVWHCPVRGFDRVASTLYFDRNFKIVRHNMVTSYTPQDPPKKKPAE